MTHAINPTHTSTALTLSACPPSLADSERQPCEIWTRVMGYHRPVSSFNIGKQGEFHERTCFTERGAALDA
jgi:anaerobic ribonucleoside-triphosphate reductase